MSKVQLKRDGDTLWFTIDDGVMFSVHARIEAGVGARMAQLVIQLPDTAAEDAARALGSLLMIPYVGPSDRDLIRAIAAFTVPGADGKCGCGAPVFSDGFCADHHAQAMARNGLVRCYGGT
jgi:hypothetical protein